MPNIKSAKKRVIVNGKKTEQNKAFRSEMKTAIKKVELLVKENNAEEAKVALAAAFKVIDSAETKNIIHKNNAANKKAKLAKKIVEHYYMREIGQETIGLFKHYAKVTMQELMEEYLPLIYSSSIQYDPLEQQMLNQLEIQLHQDLVLCQIHHRDRFQKVQFLVALMLHQQVQMKMK